MNLSSLLSLIGLKASGDRTSAERLPFPRQLQGGYGISGLLGINLPGTNIDWEGEAGDLSLNSIVGSCLGWICRNWPQAHPTVARKLDEDEYEPVDHPLNDLMLRPHPNYSGAMLAQMLVTDFWTRGNAYTHVVRTGRGTGTPLELHYLPARLMWPVPAQGASVIDHYLYRPDGKLFEVDDADIIHMRNGLDPHNLLVGRNPLASALREIVTDNEASTYGVSMVKNAGVPSSLLQPKSNGPPGSPAQEMPRPIADKIKRDWKERTTGDQRGMPMVLSSAMEVIKLAFSPKEMATDDLRRKPEERIPSLFGISPMVLDLGAGLENSTYSNKEQAEIAAYKNCLVPLWKYFAAEWTVQLLSLYPDSDGLVVWYNTKNVAALQDDATAKSGRVVNEYKAGVAKRGEARQALGYKAEEGDDVFVTDLTVPTEDDEDSGETEDDVDPDADDPDKGEADADSKNNAKKKDAAKRSVKTKRKTEPKKTDVKKSDGAANTDGAELSALYTAVERFRANLLTHESAASVAMEAAYETVLSKLQDKAEALGTRIDDAQQAGEATDQTWLFQQERYHALMDQISLSLAQLADAQADPLAQSQHAMIAEASEGVQHLATAAAGPIPDASGTAANISLSWSTLPKSAIEAMVGFASDGSPLKTLLDALGPAASESVSNALVAGLAEGLNPNDTARVITDALGGNRARAVNIARTETLRAARLASVRSYAQNADVVDGWVWLSAQDERTCSACWAMSGTFHKSDEVLDGHPQCRCVPVPQTKSWADITGDASLPDTRPNIPPGADGFGKLAETTQQSILGPGLYALFSEGKVTLADTVVQDYDARWGTMRRPATIAEAEANAARRSQ